MAFVLGKINRGIGSAIGLAWEARAHHKEKKALAATQESGREISQTSTAPSAAETVLPSTSHGTGFERWLEAQLNNQQNKPVLPHIQTDRPAPKYGPN